MLVIFLILFTNALADSDEDKYVDLLPDAEKQQFIEKVARRILEDVESKENKGQLSGEISDEQLKKHNEYVRAILKQESENIRRSKGEIIKSRDEEGEKPGSDENLDVKPLENEKIADDPDLEQVDLTLRNDRREINPLDNSTEFIKVEIINDEPPIIKRSVQNNSYSESESEEITTQATELQDKATEEPNTSSTMNSELGQSTTKPNDPTTKSNSKENLNPKLETEKLVESKSDKNITELEHTDKKQNESVAVENKVKNKGESSETDGEDIQVKKTRKSRSRKSIYEKSELNEKTTESDVNIGTVDFGVKISKNKSEEYSSSTNTDTEEFTTVTSPPETTTDNMSTTQDINAAIGQSTATAFNLPDEDKKNGVTAEYLTKNTLTSTLSDEGTTDSDIDTTTSKTDTETPTTDYYIQTRTEYFTDSPATAVATTEGMKIIVEDFTSAPKVEQKVKFVPTTTQIPSKSDNNIKITLKIKQRAEEIKEVTASQISINKKKDSVTKSKPINITTSKEIATTVKPKPTIHKPKVINNLNNNFKQIKSNDVDQSTDENFIELEKVYYNKMKKKGVKEYEVYEIPPNKPPFIQDGDPVSEQPYYVPVYNYSPNNAYFNPQNRLGPNADDDSQVSAFVIDGGVNNDVVEEKVKKGMATAPNIVDMEYSETAFDNQRKKFGNKQKLYHSIHKKPQQNSSPEKKRGKVNPEDYQDSDYYFGRIRKDLERRENHNNLDLFPNSNENVHPFHSIQEMNLKDHVRAVRNILFQQKFFGLATTLQPYESEEDIIPPKKFETIPKHDNENHPFRNGNDNRGKKNSNNIAIDYYFGRKKPQLKADNEKNKPAVQQVGYIKNENATKGLFMINHFFKDNVVNYIHELKSKDDTFVKAALMPATPLPHLLSSNDPKVKQNVDSKFRNQEKVRNAELNQIGTTPDINSIKTVLSMTNENDLFTNLKKMQDLKMKLNRRNDDVKVNAYLSVLRDMINADNKALKQYDWLGTTVDIQASFQKLFELVAVVVDGDQIHPADLEILKYVIFLHKLAKEIIEANNLGNQLRYNYALPKNKRQKNRIIKEKGLLNRVWLYLRKKVPDVDESGALKNLNMFLMDLEDDLFNLHDAIKNVAKITKYRNQHWYQNLKELYLNTDEKHLLELLLHMCVSRLFGLVEESAKNGMEDDYIAYMKNNKSEAKKTLEELLFVMQIMDEIKKTIE